LLER
jgi:hypothetical protein